MKVAIQGINGSFHHQAAQKFFGDAVELIECQTFRDVFGEVKNEHADHGVVAIENSLHGSINSVYRLLAQEKLWVHGEVRLRIELFLIAAKQYKVNDWFFIDRILSQAEALSQCEGWLNSQFELGGAAIEETNDTAASVRYVMHYPDQPLAAVAGRAAADAFGAEILAGPINDDSDNYTRFFVLSKKTIPSTPANRTSVILTEDSDTPGKLYAALGVFADLGINLSKLDSHPRPGEKRLYAFYVDFDASKDSEQGKQALTRLAKLGWNVQILGSYLADETIA